MALSRKSKANRELEWNRQTIVKIIQQLMCTEGSPGILVKSLLLSGLYKDELYVLYHKQLCCNDSRLCNCECFHKMIGKNDLVFISMSSLTARNFVIIPATLFDGFKHIESLKQDDFQYAEALLQALGIDLLALSRISQYVNSHTGSYNSYLAKKSIALRTPDEISTLLKPTVLIGSISEWFLGLNSTRP